MSKRGLNFLGEETQKILKGSEAIQNYVSVYCAMECSVLDMHTAKHEGKRFVRFGGESVRVMKSINLESEGTPVFLIATTRPEQHLFVFRLSEASDGEAQVAESIFARVSRVLSSTEEDEKADIESLWVPEFRAQDDLQGGRSDFKGYWLQETPNGPVVSEVSKNGLNLQVIKGGEAVLSGERLREGTMRYRTTEFSYVIKGRFVFGLLHKGVTDALEIPFAFAVIS